MTSPTLAVTGPGGHRVYPWQGQLYPSVTTIIRAGMRGLASPGWGVKAAAEYAVANLERLARLPAEQAVAEVQRAPRAGWEVTAGLGDLVHAAVAAHATDQPRPELPAEAAPLLAGFDRFLADHTPRFLLAEQTVYSRRYGYAGTLDAIAELPRGGPITLMEVKTGRRVYPETALQLAAYAHADFLVAPDGSQRPLPSIQAATVLHLQPENYRLVPMPADRAILDVFLAALTIFRWTTELAPQVLGDADEAGGEATGLAR